MAEPILLRIDGMFCTSCSRAVEHVLAGLDGVEQARVGFATGVASLEPAPGVDRETLLRAALRASARLGYPASAWTPTPVGLDPQEGGRRKLAMRLALGWFLGMWTMVAQVALYVAPDLDADGEMLLARVAAVAATPVVFVVGARFHLAGWRTLRAGVPGMDLLVSVGALGAWTLSMVQLWRGSPEVWFDAAAMLVVFLLGGRLLEAGARARGVDAVRRLLDLSPETVRRIEDGGVVEVPAATVSPGEHVEVPAGARLALDGVVEAGRSTLDRAALTGESRAVPVEVGEPVQAGCVNGAGVLRVRVTASVGQRVLDGIAHEVRRALDQRAEHRGLAERLSERLVPVVMGAAVLTGVASLALGVPLEHAVLRALAVLVVTCPCALGIAAPLVEVVTIGRAARAGVLVREPDALRRAGQVDVVVFDKTGTLTVGAPRIEGVDVVAAVSATRVLERAAGAEVGSEHPLGRALREAVPLVEAQGEREVVPGRGVRWTMGEQVLRVGSRAWMGRVPLPPASDATEVWVEEDGVLLGRIRLTDPVRPEAARVVAELRRQGLGLRLFSGDAPGTVASVAASVGLAAEEVRGGLSPVDKARMVREIEGRGLRVAFVGDGINDAPALAAATVGLAVSGASDAARAAAGITVRSGELSQVLRTLQLARHARRRVAANVTWALAYNALAVPLAALGLVGPGLAALAMAVSSLSVTLNAVRPMPKGCHGGEAPTEHHSPGQRATRRGKVGAHH